MLSLLDAASGSVSSEMSLFVLFLSALSAAALAACYLVACIIILANFVIVTRQSNNIQLIYDVLLFLAFALRIFSLLSLCAYFISEMVAMSYTGDIVVYSEIFLLATNTTVFTCYVIITVLFLTYLYYWLLMLFEFGKIVPKKSLVYVFRASIVTFGVIEMIVALSCVMVSEIPGFYGNEVMIRTNNDIIDAFELSPARIFNIFAIFFFFILAISYVFIGLRIWLLIGRHSVYTSASRLRRKIGILTIICCLAFLCRSVVEICFFYVQNSVLMANTFFFISDAYIDSFVSLVTYCVVFPIYYIFLEIVPFIAVLLLFSYKTKISISFDRSDSFPDDRTYPRYDSLTAEEEYEFDE